MESVDTNTTDPEPVTASGAGLRLAEFSIRFPVTICMVFISFIVLGAVSIVKIPLVLTPDLSFPFIEVVVPYPNATPLQIQESIVRPIEEALSTIPHVQRIRSRSSADQSFIGLGFDWGQDVDWLRSEVREKVEQARRELPSDVNEILVQNFSTKDRPIVGGQLSAGYDLRNAYDFFDLKIKKPLERVPGVAEVSVFGIQRKEVDIYLRLDDIKRYNVNVDSLFRRLDSANLNMSLGRVSDGGVRYGALTQGAMTSLEALRSFPVNDRGLKLSEIADIQFDKSMLNFGRHLNGEYAVGFDIRKTSQANTVETVNRVMAKIDELNSDPTLQGVNVLVWFNAGEQITQALAGLLDAGTVGALLAVGVLFLFLRRIGATLAIGFAIPFSMIATVGFLYLLGKTLNVLSMMGLMLATGMLVDNAVVVLESIYQHLEKGKDRLRAALIGTREVITAVTAATLTSIIIFVPLVFGKRTNLSMWLADTGTSIIIALLCSLFISLTLIPLGMAKLLRIDVGKKPKWQHRLSQHLLPRASALLKSIRYRSASLKNALSGERRREKIGCAADPVPPHPWPLSPPVGARVAAGRVRGRDSIFSHLQGQGWAPNGTPQHLSTGAEFSSPTVLREGSLYNSRVIQTYLQMMAWPLQHRFLVGFLIVPAILFVSYLILKKVPDNSPEAQDLEALMIQYEFTENSHYLKIEQQYVSPVEKFLLSNKGRFRIKDITSVYENDWAMTRVYFDKSQITLEELKDLRQQISKELPVIPGANITLGQEGAENQNWIGISLHGDDSSTLLALAREAKNRLKKKAGFSEIHNDLDRGREEVQIKLRRDLAKKYETSPRSVADVLGIVVRGRQIRGYRTHDGEVDIWVRLQSGDRENLEDLKSIIVASGPEGQEIQLSQVADLEIAKTPGMIEREDRRTHTSLSAVYTGDKRDEGQKLVTEVMNGIDYPPGYGWAFGFWTQRREQEDRDFYFNLLLALFMVYFVMASLFESLAHPFAIMTSLPFGMVGVAWFLYLTGTPFNLMAMIGLMVLIGIVVNNGIVMLDHVNNLRRQGMPRTEAVLNGCRERFRPILMTASTTVVGLIPLSLGTSGVFELRYFPLARTVMGGLISSTILTLIVLPTYYTLFDDLALWLKRTWWASDPKRSEAAAAVLSSSSPEA